MKSFALIFPAQMALLFFGLGPFSLEQKLPMAFALGVLSLSGMRLLKLR